VSRGLSEQESELLTKAELAVRARRSLGLMSTSQKNAALQAISGALIRRMDEIIIANDADMEAARRDDVQDYILDRLLLTPERVEDIASAVLEVVELPDPVGETIESRTVESGIIVDRRRVPLGLIGIIFESRPNVTVDISALCLKSGNCVILRGGKEAINSNKVLYDIVHSASVSEGMPVGWVQLIESTDRGVVGEMLSLRSHIDVVIPRGGKGLVSYVADNSRIPILETGYGVCHTYVHANADFEKASNIVINAKVRRPSICNALDSLLIDRSIAEAFLPDLARKLDRAGVELRVGTECSRIIGDGVAVLDLRDGDLDTEWNALRMAITLVDGLDEAIEHIQDHGSGHSEAIVTEDKLVGAIFLDEVDAAAVYLNASTQFTDGGEFGLGAEIGISTQKLHARGPMGLREMTTYKWVITGDGHVRA